MIKKYVSEIASQMGIDLTEISIKEGMPFGVQDACLLDIITGKRIVGTIVFKSDIESIENNLECARLEVRIRYALSRLRVMLGLDPELNMPSYPNRQLT